MQQNSSGLHSELDRVRLVPLRDGDKKGTGYLEWHALNNIPGRLLVLRGEILPDNWPIIFLFHFSSTAIELVPLTDIPEIPVVVIHIRKLATRTTAEHVFSVVLARVGISMPPMPPIPIGRISILMSGAAEFALSPCLQSAHRLRSKIYFAGLYFKLAFCCC